MGIVQAWIDGVATGRGNLHVIGNGNVYSYDLLIGYIDGDGNRVLIDFRAPNFVSATTSRHVCKIAVAADVVREPNQDDWDRWI